MAFAKFLGIISKKAAFTAVDGFHEAVVEEDELVSLKMADVNEVLETGNAFFLNTGSPHHVIFSEEVDDVDVRKDGAAIRFSANYINRGGTNVNFATIQNENTLKVRTYERGVEDETLSCGTGVTAVALAAYASGSTSSKKVNISARGGDLSVQFTPAGRGFKDIWLTGPAKQVFKGEIQW